MFRNIILAISIISFGSIVYPQTTLIDQHLKTINEMQVEFEEFINDIISNSFFYKVDPTSPAEKEITEPVPTTEKVETNIPDVYPITGTPDISSPFGYRKDPFTKLRAFHHGIDIAVPNNTDVLSTAPGIVFKTSYDKVGGNYIIIDHYNNYKTYYGHLSKILIRKNEKVEKGQVIGKSGNTGRSTGPHIHYQVFSDGKAIDPLLIIH